MGSITQSLWLPAGRANFFSTSADRALVAFADSKCRSTNIDDREYIPHLNTTVMRRLLEVLPRSFGYEPTGTCDMSDGLDGATRGRSVTMRLTPSKPSAPPIEAAAEANANLVKAGVTAVEISVDENGVYAFAAHFDVDSGVSEALRGHIVAVFGGKFTVDRLKEFPPKGVNEGAAAVARYNGLQLFRVKGETLSRGPEDRATEPLGILTFFQLNILVEGLCNQTLLPSVFFERYEAVIKWLHDSEQIASVLTTLDEVIIGLIGEGDGEPQHLQGKAISRFLIVSSGSLQRLKRSVGSVRRQLLEAMMTVLHRQTRLIQLDLGAVDYEASPELTGPDATESQMRGYVMLIAVKMRLIASISDAAGQAVARLELMVQDRVDAGDWDRELIRRVKADRDHWCALLESLNSDIVGLEGAVLHDWQERLLYELEQQRSEQEAIAEIERGRHGRAEGRRPIDPIYAGIGLFLASAGVAVAVLTLTDQPPDTSWRERLPNLWPIAVISLLILLAAPAINLGRKLFTRQKARNDTYGFEFAFRIHEDTNPHHVAAYFQQPKRQKAELPGFRKARVQRLGGWRIEQSTPERTLMKAHSILVVKIKRRHFARFEIVTEVVVRKVAGTQKYQVRQCRMFGESAKPLHLDQIKALVRGILLHICKPLVVDGNFEIDTIMESTDSLCGGDPSKAIPHQRMPPELNSQPLPVNEKV